MTPALLWTRADVREGWRLPTVPTLLAAGTALLLATTAMVIVDNLDRALDRPDSYGVTWDLEVSSGPDPEPAREFVLADDRIESATFVKTGELSVATGDGDGDNEVTVSAIGLEALKGSFEHTILHGGAPDGPGEIAVSTEARRRLGTSIGESVVLSGPLGSRTVDVAAQVILGTSDGATARGILVDLALLEELGGDQLVAEIDVQPSVLVSARDVDDVAAVRTSIEATGVPADDPTRPTEVVLLDEIRIVPGYLAGFVALVGALATFHALATGARRRRRELMVMHALGGTRRETTAVIRWHAVTIVTLAALAGVPLGIAAGRAAWAEIAERRDVVALGSVPWPAIAAVVGIAVLGAAALLAGPPALEIRRLRPADELREE